MTTMQDIPAVGATEITTDERKVALDRTVSKLKSEGHRVESKPDINAVLVGHNEFRVLLVRRQWGIRNRHELVEVDKRGNISIRQV